MLKKWTHVKGFGGQKWDPCLGIFCQKPTHLGGTSPYSISMEVPPGGEMRATDKVIQKNQNTAKKLKIGYAITKWRPKNQFPSRDVKFPTKNGKTTFPKEFFLEIWLIIEDCKYNYTAEIKFEKSYSVALLWGKTNFEHALKMLISRTCAWSMQIVFATKRSAR